jgi:hypothetical protein
MKWLLLFPDYWLAFSPSCLNFIKMLEENNQEYRILYFDGGNYDNSKLEVKGAALNFPYWVVKILSFLNLASFYKILHLLLFAKIIRKSYRYEKVVGFDDTGYIAARLLDRNSIYYSLEISKSVLNRFIERCINVRLLIVQTKERGKFLNKNCKNVVLLQNSPVIGDFKRSDKIYSGKFVYLGGTNKYQGIEACIDYLYQNTTTTLLIKGISESNSNYLTYLNHTHKTLIESKRLEFDFCYIDGNDIKSFLEKFDIGFCFIDPQKVVTDGFNFESSPSGKIFNYFMSGLPVVANNLLGFKPIEVFEAGVLIESTSVDNIDSAISKIRDSYSFYRSNAYNAAEKCDYRKMFNDARNKILSGNTNNMV